MKPAPSEIAKIAIPVIAEAIAVILFVAMIAVWVALGSKEI